MFVSLDVDSKVNDMYSVVKIREANPQEEEDDK